MLVPDAEVRIDFLSVESTPRLVSHPSRLFDFGCRFYFDHRFFPAGVDSFSYGGTPTGNGPSSSQLVVAYILGSPASSGSRPGGG